jgi:ribosomal protein S20
MPIIKSAIKRMHQNATHQARNINLKRDIKDATKAFRAKPTAETLAKAQSQLDIAVKKNLLKTGTAARRKSQLAKIAKDAGVKLSTAKKPSAKSAPAVTKKPAVKKKVVAKAATTKAPAKKSVSKKPNTKNSASSKQTSKK